MPNYHSITFQPDGSNTTYNTWSNWHLISSSRPVVVQPNPVYKYIDIPGRDGQLDATDYLIGRPTYSTRNGSFEFNVVNSVGDVINYGVKRNFNTGADFQKDSAVSYGDWTTRRAELASVLNGRKFKMFLDDDPNYYYYGRVFFKDWKSDQHFARVTIEYQMNPYRYNANNGEEAGL